MTGEIALSSLLRELAQEQIIRDCCIQGLENDSRRVSPGDLFLAYQGCKAHGLEFSSQAIEYGAVAIAHDKDDVSEIAAAHGEDSPVYVSVPDLRNKAGTIASRFYGNPSAQIPTIAVTGTDGKTSVTHFIAQALSLAGKQCGLVGTLGMGKLGALRATPNTTPDSLQMQKFAYQLQQDGADYLILEASSHGIDQGRLSGLAVDVAVLTNISTDHLDYHHSLQEYVATKCRLFSKSSVHHAIINRDSHYRDAFIQACGKEVEVTQYSFSDKDADVYIKTYDRHIQGMDILFSLQGQDVRIQTSLFGDFNIANLMASLLVLHKQGMDADTASHYLSQVVAPQGRMELFQTRSGAIVVLDYAHTPNALQNVLDTCRQHCTASLTCVFGCGGDRDHGKRARMGEIACQKSDYVILTDDNPRSEDPDKIISDIKQGCTATRNSQVIRDRFEAIAYAIEGAQQGDVVIIAGKGHETEQIVGDSSFAFSDTEAIQKNIEATA